MTLYWALKKYEDTGLAPEQVHELKERYTKKKPDDCLGNMPNYCEQCGQKIDWSEVENGREES